MLFISLMSISSFVKFFYFYLEKMLNSTEYFSTYIEIIIVFFFFISCYGELH